MKNIQSISRLGVAVLLLGSSSVAALTIEYCSGSNTATPDTEVTSIYQSNGRCQIHCQANYAFAVLQGQSCWCSNYIPAAQVKVSNCDSSCPGYPSDLCGNPSQGLFAYIAMSNVLPSGTATDSSGSTTANPSSTTSGTSTATDTSTTAGPSISISTIAGQPVTVTVSNSPSTQTSGSSESNGSKGSSLSGGAIAGIVIGSLVGVGAVVAFFLWYCFFSHRNDDERSEKAGSPSGGVDGSVAGGTMDTRRQSRGSQMSFMRNFAGPAGPSEQEVSPTLPTDYLSPNQAFIDNRMKKDAVLYPNGDRLSAVSLRDEEDYSRPVLRLTNPD